MIFGVRWTAKTSKFLKWSIPIAATIAAAWLGKYYFRPADLKIVDMQITDGPESRYALFTLPSLDLLLHNSGDRSAVATGVEFNVKEVWRLQLQFPLNMYLPSSQTYSIEIDPGRDAPYTLTVPISQSVKGDDADRITLTMALNPSRPFENIYHISVRVIYNDGNETAPVDAVVVLPDRGKSDPGYFMSDYYKEIENHEAAEKLIEQHRRAMKSRKPPVAPRDIRHDAEARKIDAHNVSAIFEAARIKAKRSKRISDLINRVMTDHGAR